MYVILLSFSSLKLINSKNAYFYVYIMKKLSIVKLKQFFIKLQEIFQLISFCRPFEVVVY